MLLPPGDEVDDRPEDVDEHDHERPDELAAAADVAILLLEVEEGGDHQPELDDHDRGQEGDDLLGLQLGHGGRLERRPAPEPRPDVACTPAPTCTGRPCAAARLALDSARTAAPHPAAATDPEDPMTDDRERWALILGASSGMGEATGLALAKAGYKIAGIHLDFRAALTHVEEVKAAHRRGRQRGAVRQHERGRRREAGRGPRASSAARFDESRAAGRQPYVRIVMHSLAFGSLVPFLADDPKEAVDRKKMEMTQDVMANSLVYWVQDLYRGRVPRSRLEDLRDDLRGHEPGRPVVRRRVRGEGGDGVARPPARDGVRPARHAGSRSTRSGPASPTRRPSARSPRTSG